MGTTSCPLCGEPARASWTHANVRFRYSCELCGIFEISSDALMKLLLGSSMSRQELYRRSKSRPANTILAIVVSRPNERSAVRRLVTKFVPQT